MATRRDAVYAVQGILPDPVEIEGLPEAHLFADIVAERLADYIAGRPAPPPSPLLTQAEVAAWLNISSRSLDGLVSAAEIVPVRVTPGKRGRRFTRESIEAYIRSRAVSR